MVFLRKQKPNPKNSTSWVCGLQVQVPGGGGESVTFSGVVLDKRLQTSLWECDLAVKRASLSFMKPWV